MIDVLRGIIAMAEYPHSGGRVIAVQRDKYVQWVADLAVFMGDFELKESFVFNHLSRLFAT
jgi:hypothetical protein